MIDVWREEGFRVCGRDQGDPNALDLRGIFLYD